ncbi:MAG: hypothetical protein DRJ42_26525 [Deltaproteobacteria bacterium]|nr:MAG: hypothetical protein DRJ42_26525 [Deltaproteobacteria bacterium]
MTHLKSMFFVVLLLTSAVFASTADAQIRLEDPNVERCAAQIYRGIQPLAHVPYDRVNVLRTVLRALIRAPACHIPRAVREALRLQYRSRGHHSSRESRAIAARADPILRDILSAPRRPECAPGADWSRTYFATEDCRPDAIPLRELNTGTRPRFLLGPTRLLLVHIVDALAEASPSLVASAQLVWMYASWMDSECIPSITFIWMREDLRQKRVRRQPYPDERRQGSPDRDPDADPPDARYGPFRTTPHPIELGGPC